MTYLATPVIAGVMAFMAGCGQPAASAQRAADASRTSSSPAATASASPATTPPSAVSNGKAPTLCSKWPAGSTPRMLVLSSSNIGRVYCVGVGTNVVIFLRGTPALKWAPIRASSGVLTPRANGRLALALGVTAASYAAVHPGTAVLSSYRPACAGSVPTGGAGSSVAGASPPTMMCGALLGFRVTVLVR